ncbi:MAG: hypothetical protein JKY50_16255 [Oleispira sp.]|nr:hypothetical protein [Oleispira sp.]MBL4882685.1 hypothetical protein [Oleispira sp.]
MKFDIIPNERIGPIALGMTCEEVKTILNEKHYSGSNGDSDYYFLNGLQVEFEENLANFIGISFSPDYTVYYKNINVFDVDAEKVFILIASGESLRHSYDASEYLFPDQAITLWDADSQYDRIGKENRVIWAQIGIGSQSYVEAVS